MPSWSPEWVAANSWNLRHTSYPEGEDEGIEAQEPPRSEGRVKHESARRGEGETTTNHEGGNQGFRLTELERNKSSLKEEEKN